MTTTKTPSPRRRTGPRTGPPASKQAMPLAPLSTPTLTTETLAEVTEGDERQEQEREQRQQAELAAMEERRKRSKLEERMPLRPETLAEEKARYPGRLAQWEKKKAIAESRKGHEEEDVQHLSACEDQRCEHPAHVPERRALRSETKQDRRHLGSCLLEDPACLNDSHLLPPHPLNVAEEYCCEHMCYRRTDVRSLTECTYIPVPIRLRRQRELRRNPKAFGITGSGRVEASVVVTPPVISDSTLWAWRASGSIYDPANAPLREE